MSKPREVTLSVRTVTKPKVGRAAQSPELETAVIDVLGLEAAVEELRGDDLDIRFGPTVGNFIDPVTGTLVIVGAMAGGKFVMRVIRERKGGTVIDMTKAPVEISRSRSLDYGYFVIIAKDGSVTVEAKDEPKDALERMIDGALELGSKAPLETLKAAIEGELGAKAKVELNPA